MVALSLQASKIPQKKGDNKTEKSHDPFRMCTNVCIDLRTHLRDIMLRTQRWLGVTR